MTQADSAPALRMSLASPTRGQGSATDCESLPDGWRSFQSVPDPVFSESGAHWYATAPWHVDRIKANASDYDRPYVGKLEQTVDAPTWPTLAAKVAQQVRIFEEFVEGVSL